MVALRDAWRGAVPVCIQILTRIWYWRRKSFSQCYHDNFPKFQSYAAQETSLPKRKTKTGRWLCWQSWQTRLIELIYGNNGLMTADDSICFDAKSEQIEQVSMKLSGKFLKYFQNKLKSNIKNKLNRPLTSGLVKSPWTNNNSESLNHIFKQSINWKSQPHSNSICTLTSIIETQFRTWESTCKDWSIQTLRNLQTLLSIKDCMDLKIW